MREKSGYHSENTIGAKERPILVWTSQWHLPFLFQGDWDCTTTKRYLSRFEAARTVYILCLLRSF